ncbi:MAG: response regulator, partial [Desulfobacterales bacterium]|nr:response regulator [Desulfobacterales bacterium]
SLGAIRRAGEHLLTLIDQVLDLAKIEAGRATLVETDFDLHALLDDTEDMFRPRARDKGLDLIFERAPDAPRCARTDEIKLRQTLFNLINNSLKFTKKGGVTVRVKTSPGVPAPGVQGGFWLTFEVADTGPGVAPDELNDLFKPFVQTRTGRESREGTGLGLVISRRFVQLMGGDIKVKSEGGRGTTFTFHIQAGAADAADDHGEPVRGAIALAPDQPPCRVLIADDREDNRRLLVELLNPLGFELMEAENGWEAAEVWNERRPHVICMDMRMPVMDGREAAKAIRKRESEAAPPGSAPSRVVIIAITAGAYQESRDAALAAGCDAYLSKPFHGQDLFDLMEKHSGVRFVYEESAAPESARSAKVDKSVLTPERVSVLPGKWRARMKREADKTDPIGSNAVIARIRERDEPLAAALSVLVRRYRFDIIQELFD